MTIIETEKKYKIQLIFPNGFDEYSMYPYTVFSNKRATQTGFSMMIQTPFLPLKFCTKKVDIGASAQHNLAQSKHT